MHFLVYIKNNTDINRHERVKRGQPPKTLKTLLSFHPLSLQHKKKCCKRTLEQKDREDTPSVTH